MADKEVSVYVKGIEQMSAIGTHIIQTSLAPTGSMMLCTSLDTVPACIAASSGFKPVSCFSSKAMSAPSVFKDFSSLMPCSQSDEHCYSFAQTHAEVGQLVVKLETALGTSESKRAKKLLKRLKSVQVDRVEKEEREAVVLEAKGYLLGLEGRHYVIGGKISIPEEAEEGDFQTLGAAEFLGWIRSGYISTPRRIKIDGYAKMASEAFYAGAHEVFGGSSYPAYLRKVCKIWVNLSRWVNLVRIDERVSGQDSQRMGREVSRLLQSHWRLGRSGQLAASIMNSSLHRVNVVEMLLAKGWLLGKAARLRRLPESREDAIEVQSALLLEKNQKTILLMALAKGDSAYVEEAARTMPEMLLTLYRLVDEMRQSQDSVILEAAAVLGGEPGVKRKGNINSVICHALASGRLINYIDDVCDQFRTGKMLKDMYAGIRDLEKRGEQAAAETLSKNKGSIINHALASGQLDYVDKVVAAFEGEDGFIRVLDHEVEALNDRGEKDAALALARNKGSIIYHALASGQLDYVDKVVAAFEGEDGFLKVLDQEIESLKERGEQTAAAALAKNKGSIIYHAIHSGQLEYVAKVVAAFEGEDGFIRVLDQEIESLKERGEQAAAETLSKNKGSIINHAIDSGQLEYVGKVVAAFEGEDGFLKVLDQEIESLKERGEGAAAEALAKNKGSIISHAINSGQLDYVDKVVATFEGEDGFVRVLDREIALLKKRGEGAAADALAKYKGSIISRALNLRQLDILQAIIAVFKDDKRLLAIFKTAFAKS